MKRVLITSALPYVAGVKHLGNLVGSMLPADIFARFCRARGYDTLAICATDEHGAPVELAAQEEGIPVAEFCAKWHQVQFELGERYGLSWDNFGRSSSSQNRELTLHFARALWKAGFLEIRVTKQAYSATDKRFLPDRYVIGTCPHCGYAKARGDQCENCTRVLDPIELIEPYSAVSGAKDIEIRDSIHLFLKQSEFSDKLRAWIETHRADWSPIVTSIAFKWLDEGLKDRGITRDLEWGIPVPDDIADGQLKGKVFYVWFDAPIEYIAATKEWADKNNKGDAWKDWWFGDAAQASSSEAVGPKREAVTYWEFMGKDNVPFHTVGFPVTIMGSGEPWKLVDRLKGFNWLNYDGGKFSTSGKRGIFMDQALDVAPADYWRYYLIANAPESADSNFTWEQFAGIINKDLADVLGNFVNRVTKFCVARFDGKVPEGRLSDEKDFHELTAHIWILLDQATCFFEEGNFRETLKAIRAIWVVGNEYVTKLAPWTLFKTDPVEAGRIINVCLNLCHLFARISAPIMPSSAERIAALLNVNDLSWPVTGSMRKTSLGKSFSLTIEGWGDQEGKAQHALMSSLLNSLKPGSPINAPEVLFTKISDEQVAEWKKRFSGAGTNPSSEG